MSVRKTLSLIRALVFVLSATTFYSMEVYALDLPASTVVARDSLPKGKAIQFGEAPEVPSGALSEELEQAMQMVFIDGINNGWGPPHYAQLEIIAHSEDPRLAWPITDLLRFVTTGDLAVQLSSALEDVLQTDLKRFRAWHDATDRLMAWDIPAPPNYLAYKRSVFTEVIPEWAPLFVEGEVDWRFVSWGGVRIDDRAYDQTDELCNCIPAADNPPTTDAKSAKWLDDDDIVFGIHINGEARAYPRQIMEVREMVNDTLGGRQLGIPYCTLCGSAQAWLTDEVPKGVSRPILRTSGLLSRSNKVMFDLNTFSVMDTFRGQALTGSLAEIGIKLNQVSVVTTTWGQWKKTYPQTTVLEERLALGRDFDFRNGRDAEGPIFPFMWIA